MALTVFNLDGYDLGAVDMTTLGGTFIDLNAWDDSTYQWQADDANAGTGFQVEDIDDFTFTGFDGPPWDPTPDEGVLVGGTLVQVQSHGGYADTEVTMDDGTVYTLNISIMELANGTVIMQFRDADIATMEADGFARNDIVSIELGPTFHYFRARGADRFDSTFVVCFAAGTAIQGVGGMKLVENLKLGDLVLTADGGPKPIVWIGTTSRSQKELIATNKHLPVVVEQGALGLNIPQRDLVVSRQHRFLVDSPIVSRMFGTEEVLVAAKDLVGLPGIRMATPEECPNGITYYHVLLERHELLLAEGCPTESFLLASQSVMSLSPRTRGQLNKVFMRLSSEDSHEPVRPIITGKRTRKLVARHLANGKSILRVDRRGIAGHFCASAI